LPTLLAVAKEHGRHVVSLAVGKDGKLLAAGDWDSVARVWKIVTAQAPVQSQRAETDTKKSLNGSEGSGKIRAK
jgi:WD40 repeat protein